MTLLYFAYGSNLSVDQMVLRTRNDTLASSPATVAWLADHRLTFQSLSPAGPAFANILAPGAGVWGVVYHCRAACLDRLDRFEGGYRRMPVRLTDRVGNILEATAYVIESTIPIAFGNPSAAYLDKIVSGARQHGLPSDYIDSLVALAAQGAGG